MAAYTTSLRLVLPSTGEYPGTWGSQVNTGLTSLVDNSIAGTSTITVGAADYTLTNVNGSTDEARSMFIVATGTPGAPRNVICPAVSKLYFFRNDTAFALTLKTLSGSGISTPAGQYKMLYCNGTDVVEAVNSFGGLTTGALTSASLSLTTALPATSGGTGQNSYAVGDLLYASATTALSKLADVATGNAIISGGVGVAPSYGKIGLTTHVSGTLPVTNGGTGLATIAARSIFLANALNTLTTLTPSANQSIRINSGNTAWETYTPATGDVTASGNNAFTGANTFGNATGQTFLASSTTTQDGIVVVGRAGGSSSRRVTISPTTLTANRAVTFPDAAGEVVLDTATQTLTNKTLTSPTLTTPALGTPASGVLTNCTGTATGLTAGRANGLTSATTTVAVNASSAPTAGQVLTATSSTAATWQTPASTLRLNSVTAANGTATLANGNNPIAWNWTQTTASQVGFSIGETTASTGGAGSQYLVSIETLASSTANPFRVIARGVKVMDVGRTGSVDITTFNTATLTSSEPLSLTTGNASGGTTGELTINSGDGNVSGAVTLKSGGAVAGPSGAVTVTTGDVTVGSLNSTGALVLSSGAAPAGYTGAVSLFSGAGDRATGSVSIYSGNSTGGSLDSGDINIYTGTTTASGSETGNINISVGNNSSLGGAGTISLTGGIHRTTRSANQGGIVLTAGASGTISATGGPIRITAGAGTTTGANGSAGGVVVITGGTGGLSSSGGLVTIQGGAGGATGAAGGVTVTGGVATSGLGGAVTVSGSNGVGAGNAGGQVNITAGNSVSTAGADVVLTAGTGSSNGAVDFVNTNVANGTVATTLTSLGPTGASTTVQGWLRIKVGGTVRYIPFW